MNKKTQLLIVFLLGILLIACDSPKPTQGCEGCPIPENGIVVLNPAAETGKETRVSVKEYNRRIALLASQVVEAEVPMVSLDLAFYSQNIRDLSSRYVMTELTEAQKKYNEKSDWLNQRPAVKVADQKRFQIDLYGLVPYLKADAYAYALLVLETGEILPVYPNWAAYNFTMVGMAGQPGYETFANVPFGHHKFYVVNMPDPKTIALEKATFTCGFKLDLVIYPDPVNEALGEGRNGYAWAFAADLCPYEVGQKIYATPKLHEAIPDSAQPWEEGKIVEEKGKLIYVRFSADGREGWFDWTWFAPAAGR